VFVTDIPAEVYPNICEHEQSLPRCSP